MTLRVREGSTKKATAKRVEAKPPPGTSVGSGQNRKAAGKSSAKARAAAKKSNHVPPEQRAFATNLIHLRKAAGLTQDELSARSGVSQSNISALENGTFEPRLSTIMALARAFGVAPAALLPGA